MNDTLTARAAIADVIHAYALGVRRADPASCVRLFAAGATFEVREAKPGTPGTARTRHKLEDLEAISNYLNGTQTTRICPIISNVLIDVQDHTATSTCILTSLVLATGMQIVGEYLDTFRHDSDWKFTSRVVTILGEYTGLAPQ